MMQMSAPRPYPTARYRHIAMSLWTVTACWLAMLTLVVAGFVIDDLIDRFDLRDHPPATSADYIQVCAIAAVLIVLLIAPVYLYWRRRPMRTPES